MAITISLLVLLGSAAVPAAAATPRGATHPTFGRMVFDWPGPVLWSVHHAGDRLVLHFSRPVAGDPRALLAPLSPYLRGVEESRDRHTLTFTLKIPVKIRHFLVHRSTVVDLVRDSAAKPERPAKAPLVVVRGARHRGYSRLVFQWPRRVPYRIAVNPERVTIRFGRPGRISPMALTTSLPSGVSVIKAGGDKAGDLTVALAVPKGTGIRYFAEGSRLVVDMLPPRHGAAQSKADPKANAAAVPRTEPAKSGNIKPKPAKSGHKPKPAPEPASKPDPEPRPRPAKVEVPKPVVTPAKAVAEMFPAQPAPAAAPLPATVSLPFAFDQPTRLAAFRRAGWVWLVFDNPVVVDTGALVRDGKNVVLAAQTVPAGDGGAVRLLVRPGYAPVPYKADKDGSRWRIDLVRGNPRPAMVAPVRKQFDFENRGRLIIGVKDPAHGELLVRDPQIGDVMHVVPVLDAGNGVDPGLDLPEARVLPSAQGVAMVPRADRVWLDTTHGNVQVAMPGGLEMSHTPPPVLPPLAGPAPPTQQERVKAEEVPTGPPLDLAGWKEGGLGHYYDVERRLLDKAVSLPPRLRGSVHMEMARHSVANGMGAEALGVLSVAARDDPKLAELPDFHAVRGVADYLMHRNKEAVADLSIPALAHDPKVALWLAAARARLGDPAAQAAALAPAAAAMPQWTAPLRMAMGKTAARAEIEAGNGTAADAIIAAMRGAGLSPRDDDAITFLSGWAAEINHDYSAAESDYRKAADGLSQPDRAFAARRLAELQLRLKQITTTQAINRLQHLRFAWRGGQFEYTLLKRLGELMAADHQYGNALKMWQFLVDNFASDPDIKSVSKLMTDTFEDLFLKGGADKLQPVVAIGLFNEFQQLNPPGPLGDEIIRKLADRLASVDLLGQAAQLLQHQVKDRLSGVEKAKVGARLAFLDLENADAGGALNALNESEVPNMPPALYNQRRYLRVKALADLGRSSEALALIINDLSPTANRLRVEIYWKLRDWSDDALAIESEIPPPSPGKVPDKTTRHDLIDLATALTLAKDEPTLARIRRLYGPMMAKTPEAKAFNLLTSPPEQGIINYQAIPGIINQVEGFQSFMNEWQKKVKKGGLSSLN